jgi:hypothetical protein
MGFKMDMIYRIVMPRFGGFTGVVASVEIFKADKMDKMDIKYIFIFLSTLILGVRMGRRLANRGAIYRGGGWRLTVLFGPILR